MLVQNMHQLVGGISSWSIWVLDCTLVFNNAANELSLLM